MNEMATFEEFEDLVDGYGNARFVDLGDGADETARADLLSAYIALIERIAELEAQLQSFRDFNALPLRLAAEEGPNAWEHLQEATNET